MTLFLKNKLYFTKIEIVILKLYQCMKMLNNRLIFLLIPRKWIFL